MTHLVTGYKGEEHILSEDQGSFNASFFGTGEFVMEQGNMLEASITSNNNVRVLDGDILMQGRHIRIKPNTYEDKTITTGTAGMNRNDLIVMTYAKDESTGVEDAYLEVIKGTESSGTASDPAITAGDIIGSGASKNQMPLYRVKIEGVVLTEIECLFTTIPTYKTLAENYEKEFKESCNSHLNSLNILDTMEEIEANTQKQQLAGALALKELKAATNNGFSEVNESLNVKTYSTVTEKSQFTKLRESVKKKNDRISFNAIFCGDSTTIANTLHWVCTLPVGARPIMQIDSGFTIQDGVYNFVGNGLIRISTDGTVSVSSNISMSSKYIQFTITFDCE